MNQVAVARHIVQQSVNVVPHETALVLTSSEADQSFATAMVSALREQGAQAAMVTIENPRAIPHGYLSWEEPEPLVAQLLAAADVAVVYLSTLVVLSKAVAQAREQGTRLLFIPADYDLSRRVVIEEDLGELSKLGESVCATLVSGQRARVLGEGTELELELPGRAFFDDARVINSGDVDFFPGGMWNVVPRPESVNGIVRLGASAYPLGRLASPIMLRFEGGRIVTIEGGWEAKAWKRWLESFADDRVFEFSHLSGGLARCAAVIGHDWEDLISRGSVLISGGESVLYGGRNAARGHFDAIVPDATVEVDGHAILAAGDYI
jgi:leucyl aminopeptidase (aminopeptidase T)